MGCEVTFLMAATTAPALEAEPESTTTTPSDPI
jgi:hypothetical protein